MPEDSAKLDSAAVATGIAGAVTNGSSDGNNDHGSSSEVAAAMKIQEKYVQERSKRLRAEGNDQYIDVGTSERFKHFAADPWVESEPPVADAMDVVPDSRCKILILGAGFVGLTTAVRLVEAGIDAKDIRIADTAAGFGGTWYWNRYPGLMCDVESYIYMPLLEEMNYMPTHKYAYGTELRSYANLIADTFHLRDKALFQTSLSGATWDDNEREWIVQLKQERNGYKTLDFQVRASIFCIASGVLHHPKLPSIPGIENFKGQTFHTARWDYNYTRGSPSDWNLTKLHDKRVGYIGTGATAIQAVPQLSKHAKELYVFQRTPSSVDERNQRPTDSEWWAKETKQKGWQRKRNLNFSAHFADTLQRPEVNMVGDAWTGMPSFRALIGSPDQVTMDNVGEHVAKLHASDLPRQERIRARVDATVKDPATAQKLKAWYPGWCKRPCFHDDYLPTFNKTNVYLIDTDGAGVSSITESGVVVNGKEYPVDLLIFGTGFRTPTGTSMSKANMKLTGRGGVDFDQKSRDRMATLHGVCTHDFPNFFFFGPFQAGTTAHWTWPADELAQHVAYMIVTAEKQAGPGKKVAIEPSVEAEEAWTMQIMMRAISMAAASGCTPGYINAEGDLDRRSPEEQGKTARMTPWGDGYLSFLDVIEGWRAEGKMDGLEITVA